MNNTTNFDVMEEDIPVFYRLNSEVVEKQDCLSQPSAPSTPVPSVRAPSSPASSCNNKADSVLGWSDSEMEEQGDVDEGFDEEFEERDLNDSDHQQPSLFPIEDFDPKELQQILGMSPDLTGLEDFDLGVDVLDNEQGHLELPPLSMNNTVSRESPTSSVSSSTQESPAMSVEAIQRNLIKQMTEPLKTESSTTTLTYNDGESVSQSNDKHMALSLLVSECGMMDQQGDLTETFALAAALPSSTDSPSIDLQSMLLFGNGSGQLNLLPPASSSMQYPTHTSSHITSSPMASHVTAIADSSMFPPTLDETVELYNSLSPLYDHCVSPSPIKTAQNNCLSQEEEKIIDMPYYHFRKILDDSSISENKKEEFKTVRRKGKNKVAAKVCRHKKVVRIQGLELEVQQFRERKVKMTLRIGSLEQEISRLKRQCQQHTTTT